MTAPHQYLRPFFHSARKYTPTIHTVQQPLHHSTRTKGADLRPHAGQGLPARKQRNATKRAQVRQDRQDEETPGHTPATRKPRPPYPRNRQSEPPRTTARQRSLPDVWPTGRFTLYLYPATPTGLHQLYQDTEKQ